MLSIPKPGSRSFRVRSCIFCVLFMQREVTAVLLVITAVVVGVSCP